MNFPNKPEGKAYWGHLTEVRAPFSDPFWFSTELAFQNPLADGRMRKMGLRAGMPCRVGCWAHEKQHSIQQ